MRQSIQLALVGAAVVHLSFFSWPVPRVVKDVLHTGVGKLVFLSGISYLALYQSPTLAILAAIFYVKSVHSLYHEGFTADSDTCKDRSKLSDEEKKDCAKWDARPTSAQPSTPGSSSGATPSSSPKTEHYENFATF